MCGNVIVSELNIRKQTKWRLEEAIMENEKERINQQLEILYTPKIAQCVTAMTN